MAKPQDLKCPSGDPTDPDAEIFGIVLGTVAEPKVSYLERNVTVDPGLLAKSTSIDIAHAFRFSAPCKGVGCGQFSGGQCQLGKEIVKTLVAESDDIPACSIRNSCRWFHENGVSACHRCPLVTTRVLPTNDALFAVTAARAADGAV